LDSMVLLHLLHRLATRWAWKLAVAHLNHRLRGRSSDLDERLVRKVAAELGLPAFVERVAVRPLAWRNKVSLEMAARQVRHAFLAQVAARWRARTVALAHQADDQVELFFLRLLRGAGGEGLQGMQWKSPSPADRRRELVRPLLDVPRAALLAWARTEGVRWREDASNASTDFLRNRIRHDLLPRLKRLYQPALARTVLRAMEITGAEAAAVNAWAQTWHASRSRPDFAALPLAVQRAILRRQLMERGLAADFELVESLVRTPGRRVAAGVDTVVWRGPDGCVHVGAARPPAFCGAARMLELGNKPGGCDFEGVRLAWRVSRQQGDRRPAAAAGREFFDAAAVGSPVVLRHWRPGDRFQPIGLPRPAKLQDLFTNARIPPARRRELLVATTADGRIFWVEGLRIGEAFKLVASTRRRLTWRWKRLRAGLPPEG